MEASQTSEDTTTQPVGILPLHAIPGRRKPNSGTGESVRELKVNPIVEAIQQASRASYHNVVKDVRLDLHIHVAHGGDNEVSDSEGSLRIGVGNVGGSEHGMRIKDSLGDAEALRAKDEVVAIWELEGAHTEAVGGRAVRVVRGYRALIGPHLCGALFELGEDTLFLELVEAVGGRLAFRPVRAQGGFRWLADFDGNLGEDLVVRTQRYVLRGEVGADLVAQEVAAEGDSSAAFLEDEAVVDRRDGDVGCAEVNDQS